MEFIITENPSDEDIFEIRQGLRHHNLPFLGDISDNEVACFSYAADGAKIGGITGRIWGHWLLIKFLWVDQSVKHQGIGSRLLAALEEYAKQNGCRSVLVDTFSFQAKPFYEKHGYRCQMTLNDYPVADQLHFLTKELS